MREAGHEATATPDETDVRTLLGRVAEGDEGALREFYDRYSGAVYRFALSRLESPADAADVLNEVMLEVWRGAARFRGGSSVRTWILGIAHHKTVDRIRRRVRDGWVPEDEAPEAAEGAAPGGPDPAPGEAVMAAAQDADLLRRCLERLSGLLRQAVYLAFFEDRSYPEIARILDCPVGTVKTRVFHAKRALRECLERLAGTDEGT